MQIMKICEALYLTNKLILYTKYKLFKTIIYERFNTCTDVSL